MDNTSTPPAGLSLGRLAPALLVLIAVVELVLRFVPLGHFSFRAWEALVYKHALGEPFRANGYYHNERCYGDLANMLNVPEYRQYHSETFTTDAYGYRNPTTPTATNPPAAILIGSSFSVGCGVSDYETLAAQLGRLAGCLIYNAAFVSQGPEHRLENIREFARRLHLTGGTVLYEVLNSTDYTNDQGFIEFAKQVFPSRISIRTPSRLEEIQSQINTSIIERLEPWTTSRLEILARQAHQRLENNWFFPNYGWQSGVTLQRLTNGGYMMLQKRSPPMTETNRDVSWSGAYFPWLARELRRDNLSLLVFLVPDKNTVYEPLLADPSQAGPNQSEYLARVEAQLHAAGVNVVNLDPALRAYAQAGLASGHVIYMADDIHWNSIGIAVAAQEINQHFTCSPKP